MRRATIIGIAAGSLAIALACSREESPPATQTVVEEEIEVELCDGETTTSVPARASYSEEEGLVIADELMAQWKKKHPDRDWVEEERSKHMIEPPADNSGLVGRTQGDVYGQITERTVDEWERETLKLVVRGSQIFHSADELGSQIAVSCDMCHPDAANTHPETYPKFQVQLGRAVLLRDMINWCIEHPVRGKVLAADSAEMRALEAYILAQRKGTALVYGKH